MFKVKPGMVVPLQDRPGWQATILIEGVGELLVQQVFCGPTEAKANMRKIVSEHNEAINELRERMNRAEIRVNKMW